MRTKDFDLLPAGANILARCLQAETKTASGIVLPESVDKEKSNVQKGLVIEKGPGFIIPPMPITDSDSSSIEDILREASVQVKYLPLDVNVGDIIFYIKAAADEVRVDGIEYVIIPFGAVKLVAHPFIPIVL